MKTKELEKKANDKGFASGVLYACQLMAIYRGVDNACFILHESGLDEEEMREQQKESGYENELMEDVFKEVYSR